MRTAFVVCILAVLAGGVSLGGLNAQAPASESARLLPVQKAGKWGFIGLTGKLVIQPTFDEVRDFSEGLAAVCVNGKWGFIDATGKVVVKPRFDEAGFFIEGRAFARDKRKWGLIDRAGKWVVQPQFDEIIGGSHGPTPVCVAGKWGYVDAAGAWVVQPQFAYAAPFGAFSDGLAQVNVGGVTQPARVRFPGEVPTMHLVGGKWGYVDRAGKPAIKPQFDDAEKFSDGLAPVQVGRGPDAKWGYIDKTGKYIWEPSQ